MEKDKIYFGSEGLTTTSANYVANMAKEMCQTTMEKLESVTFLDSSIGLIGGEFTDTQKGVVTLTYMKDDLDRITKAHSLIAWLREAIKAKDTLSKEVAHTSLEDYCKMVGKELPVLPDRKDTITKDKILATWSVKDRNKYLMLGAKTSAYGKFLHPSGRFSIARQELKKRINNPVTTSMNGRDTILIKYKPSISAEAVDTKFYELQQEWRKAQAELNSYEHKIQLIIDEDTNKNNTLFLQQCAEYKKSSSLLEAELKAWKDQKSQEIADLKIIIPNDLTSIYKEVVNLSKDA